jgi:hypothetical protein
MSNKKDYMEVAQVEGPESPYDFTRKDIINHLGNGPVSAWVANISMAFSRADERNKMVRAIAVEVQKMEEELQRPSREVQRLNGSAWSVDGN